MRTRRNDSSFRERVFAITKSIPAGKTLSYGEVAVAAGHPGAARAVGNILHTNHDPSIPCHRVIRADGTPGGYNGGEAAKRAKLAAEGAWKSR